MWGSLLVMDRGREEERKDRWRREQTYIMDANTFRRGEERRGKEEELSQRKVQARG